MMEERFKLKEARPLWQKAMEIRELVANILAAAPEPQEEEQEATSGRSRDKAEFMREGLKQQIDDMHMNALMIPAKIAGAEGGDIYDLRMENAALIRKAARELVVGLRGLEMFGFDEPRYFDLLREEMEEFRKLFVAWVAAFDKKRFITDDWGLFNPPGINPGNDIIGDLGHDEDETDDPF